MSIGKSFDTSKIFRIVLSRTYIVRSKKRTFFFGHVSSEKHCDKEAVASKVSGRQEGKEKK